MVLKSYTSAYLWLSLPKRDMQTFERQFTSSHLGLPPDPDSRLRELVLKKLPHRQSRLVIPSL